MAEEKAPVASQEVEAAKEALKGAKAELTKFTEKHGDAPEDEKLAKKLNKLKANVDESEKAVRAAKKAAKPKKEKAERQSKYDYPADCTTAEQKKKFRTEARRAANGEAKAAKKAEKAEKAPKAEGKKEKKAKKASTED